jgi:argininosuccinate lyase
VSSAHFDGRLAPYDIAASDAHVEMLGRRGIIPRADAAKIRRGLAAIARRLEKGGRLEKAEDVHFALEKTLITLIGPVGGKMHTARSRNDQTVTALRLYLRDHLDGLRDKLADLSRAFLALAEKNITAVMPGFTHLQPGQPLLAAHHLLAYGWMFVRDRDRLADARRRVNQLPLGAAALAGTTFPIDRVWVAERLGFDGVMENSVDAVSDRDFAVEFLGAASLIMAHLSRWAEEVILWTNPSFGFASPADAFVTGSSIMPQKRNPDIAELLRGKAGRVFGDLTALLTLIKGTPLAYNRDFQEDKPPLFDAVETVEACLDVAVPMTRTLVLYPDKMRAACRLGFLLATDAADALARRGLPFRQAHGVVAEAVRWAAAHRLALEEISLSQWRRFTPLAGPWMREVLTVNGAVAARRSRGGTAPGAVRAQMALLKKALRS